MFYIHDNCLARTIMQLYDTYRLQYLHTAGQTLTKAGRIPDESKKLDYRESYRGLRASAAFATWYGSKCRSWRFENPIEILRTVPIMGWA